MERPISHFTVPRSTNLRPTFIGFGRIFLWGCGRGIGKCCVLAYLSHMTHNDTDARLKSILTTTRTIGLVGLSHKPERASHGVAAFLVRKGYRVIGVNPGLAGQEMFGEKIVASVTELPAETDMLDLFRRSDAVAPIVDEALAALPGLKTVWMQLGVENAEARAHAEAMGVTVIENRCPKIEYPRLFGEAALVELVG
ncbi:Predicted CoA-binding protein [Aliiroseovarius sediminilitoris]|uniref:Predicted CoA-binding protein n=2 Tax=Aliiroseovarius sediminilitoris TaxID=1173584 RepID=A0A1I0NSL0_9RHOB|nr:Predicted CoA-binding protein [Aliiroseovarius sediminilitoris]